eukprot:TRINITY_DN7076_c0_g3_i1.p1 TRINITY_DN7076_c0_g3~~TRINITY_DN7076_c0_g3_i1.p1  ORF type:complete len:107 (-),score=14.82 TRINITY_DN7076_c0_g3_i1:117-437(-)
MDIFNSFWQKYQQTPHLLKLIDVYLGYILITGVLQFVYCVLVGTFPFNAFLSGFISTVASFVLTVSLRMQVNPNNKFKSTIPPERAFFDYLFCNVILHFVIMSFIG